MARADDMVLDCGISITRIRTWLEDELALPQREDGCWLFGSGSAICCVSATPLEDREFGRIRIERTQLAVTGDSTAIEAFHQLFTLRFVSAGG